MKIIVDNVYSKLEGYDPSILEIIDDELAVKQPGYFFSPSFKNGYWDGKIRFLDKKAKTFPTGLLEKVLKATESDVEIVDNRKPIEVKVSSKIELYEPDAPNGIITLRDYQYEAVKNSIEKTRGIVNVATNGGKTEIASGIIKQLLPVIKKSQKILFVTHSKEIASQSAKRIAKRLNIEVGMIGDGVWDEKQVTVAMIPTISKYIKKPTPKGSVTYTKEFKGIRLILDFIGESIKKGEKNRSIMIQAIQVLEEEYEKKVNAGEVVRASAEEKAIDILTEIITTEKNDNDCLKAFNNLRKELRAFEEKKLRKAFEKHEETLKLLESAICYIGDEFHHSSSSTWYDTLMLCKNAVYRIGLTGTVDRKDEINFMRMLGCTGEIVIKISNDFLISEGHSAKPTIFLDTIKSPKLQGLEYKDAYEKGIVENELRNAKIALRVIEKYNEGKGCLVIVNRKKHGETIKKLLEENGVECEFTHGSFSNREGVLEDMKKGKLKVLIATTILDEGVDVSGIGCLWMAAGGKSFRQVLQRIGRGLRKKEDGSGLEVYDFLDFTNEHLTKHTQERYQYYKDEKFEIKKV